MSSEVDERQSTGRLASPLLMQKREASAVLARIHHSTGETSTSHSSHIRKGDLLQHTHTKEVEHKHKKCTGDTSHKWKNTIHPEINPNDPERFWNHVVDSNSNFVVVEIISKFVEIISNFLCVRSSFAHIVASHLHVLWPVFLHMC